MPRGRPDSHNRLAPQPCRFCFEPVLWAITANRKRMPLNPELDPAGNQAVYRDEFNVRRTRTITADRPALAHEKVCMPHAATCTGLRKPEREREAPPADSVVAAVLTRRCPMCGLDSHPPCLFVAGSSYCAVRDCRNPHHKAPPC